MTSDTAKVEFAPVTTQVFTITVDCGQAYTVTTSAAINFHGIAIVPVE